MYNYRCYYCVLTKLYQTVFHACRHVSRTTLIEFSLPEIAQDASLEESELWDELEEVKCAASATAGVCVDIWKSWRKQVSKKYESDSYLYRKTHKFYIIVMLIMYNYEEILMATNVNELQHHRNFFVCCSNTIITFFG